jgi:hypothetical protein
VKILAKCSQCDAGLPVDSNDPVAAIRCGRCSREISLTFSDAVRSDLAVDLCPVCQGGDFYKRKDFAPNVGLTIIIVGATVSSLLYWYGRDLYAYGILGGAALVDLFVYGRLKDITICYRCHTEFRGARPSTAPIFDLKIADVLELEYERKIGRR